MLLVKTRLGKSKIHGLGCFAEEFIPAGTVIGRWDERFDRSFTEEEYGALPPEARAFIDRCGYKDGGLYCLNADNTRFFNHADNPNTIQTATEDVARQDIEAGEEITCNYYMFDSLAVKKLREMVYPGWGLRILSFIFMIEVAMGAVLFFLWVTILLQLLN
jgi:hypothetical protein